MTGLIRTFTLQRICLLAWNLQNGVSTSRIFLLFVGITSETATQVQVIRIFVYKQTIK